MNTRIVRNVFRKDVLSLLPLVALTMLLFASDVVITRLDLLPVWEWFRLPVLALAGITLTFALFQLDSAASLVDDWLCRPVPLGALVTAKLALLFVVTYLSRAITMFITDLAIGLSIVESLQEALLIQDRVLLFLMPVLLMTAVVTQTFVQGIGVLIAIFVCVFVLPTPWVRGPGPLDLGLSEGLFASGMIWLAMTPAKLLSPALLALALWLAYWRRRLVLTRFLLALTVVFTVILHVLPGHLLPWHATYAMQTSLLPEAQGAGPAILEPIRLRSSSACFPATRLGSIALDAAFEATRQMRGLQVWGEESVANAGAESIAFLTHVDVRALPEGWRARTLYARADLLAGEETPRVSLRPASYLSSDGGDSLAHAWLLPVESLRKVQGQSVSLRLSYSLMLLKPRRHGLATDGARHYLPGLGYCGARVDQARNVIDVDCFAAADFPAQISAELEEIPATRSQSDADYAPRWAKIPYGRRVELKIASPRLGRHDRIMVTAWDVAGHVDKSLTLPGLLGDDPATCPLPDPEADRFRKSRWRDAAPHQVSSVGVDAGVQLEVLDFGGGGSPILLLPGLGATAHSYDELAPQLARKHRVIAITRRGTGDSSRPDSGYDTARLAKDVLRVMDAMELPEVLLVGHSIAGDELTWLGGHYPERFSGLVYLDAAYDRSQDPDTGARGRLRELSRLLPAEPPIPPAAFTDYETAKKIMAERGHVRYPEGELMAFLRMNTPFLAGIPAIDARTQQAISAAIAAPDYRAVKLPALAIYAFEDTEAPLPSWYDADDSQERALLQERNRIADSIKRESIEQFRAGVARGQVLELRNSSHYIQLSNPDEVLAAIEAFAANL